MAQSKGTHYKLTWTKQYDKNKKETGYSQLNLTIDCEATPNAVDVNVELLAAMCTAKEKYLYEVNAMVTGKIRDKEDLVSAPIGSNNKDKFRAATNLSVTDRADPPSSTSDPMMRARYKMFNAQPLNGFDGHIYLSPNTNSVRYFNTEVAGKPLPKPGSSVDPIDTQPLPRPVLAYHEMTECFFRTTGGMIMRDAHKRAEEWEARNKKAQALPGYLDNGKPLIIQHN
jgi:hypothetical protein